MNDAIKKEETMTNVLPLFPETTGTEPKDVWWTVGFEPDD